MNEHIGARWSRRHVVQSSLAAAAALTIPTGPRSVLAQDAAGTATPGATPVATSLGTPTTDRAPLYAELDAYVQSRMVELQVPGVVVGIVDGETQRSAGFGVTSLDNPLAVDAGTLFQIGSTTKTFTGTTTMRLVEQGLLDLDAPVRSYLPDFRVTDETASETVLVRNLLNHTAGWFGDDLHETGDNDDALARYVADMAALPQLFPVGAYFSYNNAAVDLMGRVIEVVTGKRYEDVVHELVLEPLGMTSSFYFAEEIMTHAFAVGHTASPDDPTGPPDIATPWAIPRASNPAGGVISSIDDQLRYVRFHLGDGSLDGQRLLQPETMRAMQEPTGPGGSMGTDILDGVGINWLLSTRAGVRVVAHGGSTNGQQSAFVMVPERGLGVTVLTNSNSGALLGEEVTDWVLDRFLGLPRVTPPTISLSPEELGDYPGTYDFGGQPATAELGDAGLSLTIIGQTLKLDPIGDDQFLGTLQGLQTVTDFVRGDDGRVNWIRISGRMAPRTA